MTKRALITGITGQDGSFLSELLLEQGYEVYGVIRRSSSFNTDRIDHLYRDPHDPEARLRLVYGDLNDSSSLNTILRQTEPDEIYNLGAQSHVRVSFDVPEYTGEVTGLGTVRLLEAVREVGIRPKFYQASSSELYGDVRETPQTERTPFYPRSPYACAKAYAFYITVNYRESYDMFACNGILFNHECLSSATPLIVRRGGTLDICTPGDLIALRRKGANVQTFDFDGTEVWDGEAWTPLVAMTATRRRAADLDHRMISIQARAGVVDVTAHHGMLNGERMRVRADEVEVGSRLALAASLPAAPGWTSVSADLAEFLGYLTAEGYVSDSLPQAQFTCNDGELRSRVAELWSRLFLGASRVSYSRSGFEPRNEVGQLYLTGGGTDLCRWLRAQLYTRDGYKKVPALVLNAAPEVQNVYLKAYYAGDGLKAGNGDSVKTNSAVLAQGLCWLYNVQGRQCSVYVERRGERAYYQLNILSGGTKGQHLRLAPEEVRAVEPAVGYDEWVFDVETGSNVLCAGIGRVVVHNSERRGETFVSRKITRAAGRIKLGLQEKLYMGNLDARRDWGYARDYVRAMHLMMQAERPDDYVIATGETHTVREFLDLAFGRLDLDWREHVEIDPRYFRPAEVDLLLGDATRARRELGWEPEVTFPELVRIMVDHDLELARQERIARDAKGGSVAADVRWQTV